MFAADSAITSQLKHDVERKYEQSIRENVFPLRLSLRRTLFLKLHERRDDVFSLWFNSFNHMLWLYDCDLICSQTIRTVYLLL